MVSGSEHFSNLPAATSALVNFAGIVQLVERDLRKVDVGSSILSASTNARIAQMESSRIVGGRAETQALLRAPFRMRPACGQPERGPA